MHGRDQLSQNWPSLFTADQSAQLPAEEIVQLEHVPPELNRQDSHGVLDRRFYRH
jgi:hypothetical protein